ncbi:unnamed protein product [Sphenostylis stenocarpa]|uniref:Uncharacterized protein n=1 Tax=Sphenostylis stenocarpa TaxID=92480 RepID=A0AA86ST59_9FABA|nr:unnamed protein product [Sphenostylis stenocarpa]
MGVDSGKKRFQFEAKNKGYRRRTTLTEEKGRVHVLWNEYTERKEIKARMIQNRNAWHIEPTSNVTSAYKTNHTPDKKGLHKIVTNQAKANAVEDTFFLNNKKKQLSSSPP